MRAHRFAGWLLAGLAAAGCKEEAPKAPEAQLATDLPAETVDQILKAVAKRGGPTAERIAGLGLGAGALVPEAGRPPGTQPDPDFIEVAGRHADAGHAQVLLADGGEAEPPPQRPGVTEPVATARDGGVASPPPAGAGAPLAPPSLGGDVRWDLEPYGAIAAAQRGQLLPMPAAGADVPDLWRDPGGTWIAVGGRARVLLVNETLRGDHARPTRLSSLVDPWFKGKVALAAPTGGAALAHFAALYTAWGEPRTRAWLKALRDNGAQVLPTDAEVRLAVVQGRATVGLLGSDEAAKAAAIAPVSVVYPDQRTIGTFVWPTALSRPRNSAHPERGSALAEELASKATEQQLAAREPGFIPLRPGIPVPTGVRSAWNLRVVAVEPALIVANIDARRAELAAWAAGR
jgi:ABC-type Fe3+ transport system substrate-binding protein